MADLRYNPLSIEEDICCFRPVPRCSVCSRRSTFVSPSSLCDEHWCRWWGEGDPSGRMYREAKFGIWADTLVRPMRWLAWKVYDLMERMFGRIL